MESERFVRATFLSSLASSLIGPFIPMYALFLGATKTFIGILSSLYSFSSLFTQLFWSALVETRRKRNLFIIIGYFFWSLFWIPISFVKSTTQLLILLLLQASFSSMIVPAWQSILVVLVPKYRRGRVNSEINLFSSIGSFIGALIGGYLIHHFGFKPFLFYIVSFIGLSSSIPFIPYAKEKFSTYGRKFTKALKNLTNTKEIRNNEKFMFLVKTMVFFNFATSIAGPMFSVYILQNLGGDSITLAILSAISAFSAVIFYKPWGILVDYLGRKTVIIGCLLPIAFFPFVYAVSNHVIWIYLYEVIGSMSWGGFNIALFSYLSDIVPKESTPTYLSLYNFFVGSSTVIGSFLSGIIADAIGIKWVFVISFILRLSAIRFFYSLGEKRGTRPVSVFNLSPLDNVSYQIENTVFVYLQVFREARRNTVESFIRKLFRSFR